MLDKIFGVGGWSSKKVSGFLLIMTSIIMGFISLIISSIVISEACVLIGIFLTAGLGCFGVDSYNKTVKINKKYE